MSVGRRFTLRRALLASAAVLGSTVVAVADEAPPAKDTAKDSKETKVERVVVTAQKKSELIRDVPMGVTAITGDQLDRLRATSFSDFVALVPGLSSNEPEPTHTVLTIRGIN